MMLPVAFVETVVIRNTTTANAAAGTLSHLFTMFNTFHSCTPKWMEPPIKMATLDKAKIKYATNRLAVCPIDWSRVEVAFCVKSDTLAPGAAQTEMTELMMMK